MFHEIFWKKYFTVYPRLYVYRKSSYRSIRSQMLFKIGVLKNFANFTGKYLCQSLFFDKGAGLRLQLWTHVGEFLWNLQNTKNTFFHRTRPVTASDHIMKIIFTSICDPFHRLGNSLKTDIRTTIDYWLNAKRTVTQIV